MTTDLHSNGRAAKDPNGSHTPLWGVWYDGLLPTPNTYGPFKSRKAAEEFCRGFANHHVFCFICDRQSACGPWLAR